MNLGITTFGSDGGRSGIGRYTTNLIRGLTRLGQAEVDLYAFHDEQATFAPGDGTANCLPFPTWLKPPVMNIAWHQWSLAGWCRKRRHDVLFLPAGNRRLPLHCPCPTVGTIHDFSSLHVANKYNAARLVYIKQVLPRLARQLTHVLTVSESSKRDIVEYAGVPEEKVTVTPLAVDHERYQQDPAEARARLQMDRPYILFVSRIEHPGKNHVKLIEAFARLKQQHDIPHDLVLAGSDWNGAEVVHAAAEQSSARDSIHFTGFVSERKLVDLYNCADVLAFPSLYEGFGLPILEAMTCGTPVACADTSSLPEVAGDAAAYFDPHSADSMSDAIWRILDDSQYRDQCITRGRERAAEFTWQRTAEQTMHVLREAAAA